MRVELYRPDKSDFKMALHCVLPDDDADWQQYVEGPTDVSVFDENRELDNWLRGFVESITYSEYTLENERTNRTLEEYERVRRGKLAPWTPSDHNVKRMRILKRILLSFILRAARDRRKTYRIAFSFVGNRKDVPQMQDLKEEIDLEGIDL